MSVAIHGEAVADGIQAKMARNTSETEHREGPVIIVWLYNSANIKESGLILIVTTLEVQ